MPEAMSISSRGDGAVANAAVSASRLPLPFADDLAGSGYFLSDHHHRHLAVAIFRQLAKGHGFVLLAGEPPADGELLERLLNEEGKGRYRATFLRCRPDTDFGALVRAYNRRLGLKQESGTDGIWALLSHLMQEVRRGVARILVLEHADALDATCFDELLRFTRLDEPHVMPVVLVAGAGFDERVAASGLDFLQPAITCRLASDQLERAEIAAFIRYQLNALPVPDQEVFSAEAVNRISAEAGPNPAAVNRLARALLDTAALSSERAAHSAALIVPAEPAAEAMEAPSAAATEALPAELPVVLSEPLPPPQSRWRKFRLPPALIAGIYVLAISLAGLGLLHLLAPRHTQPTPAQIAAPAASPLSAPVSQAVAEAPSDAAASTPPALAAQAAAIEPAAGTPAASTTFPIPQPSDAGAQKAAEAPTASAADRAAAIPEPPPLGSLVGTEAPAASPGAAPVPVTEPPAPAAPTADAAPTAPVSAPLTAAPTATVEAGAAPATNSAPVQEPAPAPAQLADDAPAAAASVAAPAPTPERPSAAAAAANEPSSASSAAPAMAAAPASPAPQVAVLEASPAPPTAKREAPRDPQIVLMVARGDALLAAGDIVSARRFFERGAEAGDADALCGVAKTYDTEFLRLIGVRGVAGDAATAVAWYRRAAAAGCAEAAARLHTMTPDPSTPEERR